MAGVISAFQNKELPKERAGERGKIGAEEISASGGRNSETHSAARVYPRMEWAQRPGSGLANDWLVLTGITASG